MIQWEIKDIFDLLKKAQEGNTEDLKQIRTTYRTNCAIDNEYNTMVIRRAFEVEIRDHERCILSSDVSLNKVNPTWIEKQWGLTILRRTPTGNSVQNYCIPNTLKKVRMRLLDKDMLEINSYEKTVTAHITEIERKLKPILGIATEDEIQKAFDSLSSQQYVIPTLVEVVYQSLNSKTLGILQLEDQEYDSIIRIDSKEVLITIYLAEADILLHTLDHADKLMEDGFYEKALRGMYPRMLDLKNDYWLEEETDSDTERLVLTLDEFKNRITISEITFHHDYTTTIVCNTDDMFTEHTITINTDAKGNYKESFLNDLVNRI